MFYSLLQELLEVVELWDREIRKVLPEDGFWFAPLSPDTGEINPDCREPNDRRVMLSSKKPEGLDK